MSDMERERDLVLNPNEYAYVLDKTKGLISCVVGSYKMSLSTSDSLVIFNERTKRFEEAGFQNAISTFMSAPENWYIVLKNPTIDNKHPNPGTSNTLPELQIGKKINIPGNTSFALYPGQMAKAIQGHRLHSNQYLLARVYDADIFGNEDVEVSEEVEVTTEEGKIEKQTVTSTVTKKKYTVGQLLIIKGTETSFYIPPTGIEVLPITENGADYIREAVTLERLEYCILKDEEGNKKYIHGSAVVFPEPDEKFIVNPENDSYKFHAIELSEISGIYIKVIADYKEKGKEHQAGEELFITGKDQMIYYPRPEHAIIKYGDKVIHHAVAIPVGEGRYILDRKTGSIKMVKGPAMFLPDPRTEVIVKRKLTAKQCELWYPGNNEVLKYNLLVDTEVQQLSCQETLDSLPLTFHNASNVNVEENSFSRSTTYTKPRMITIDNKYDGVVSIDVWTGYAINVVSKDGKRKMIVGPQTYLLGYDENLEILELSTGKPKTTDCLLQTVYLRVNNNKISDIIDVQTKDFANISIKVSYCVDFLADYEDKWFGVENYVKYLCDRFRSLIKKEVKKYTINNFLDTASDIIRNVIFSGEKIDKDTKQSKNKEGYLFRENGMLVRDVEVLGVTINNPEINEIINENQINLINNAIMVATQESELEVSKKLAKIEEDKIQLDQKKALLDLESESKVALEKIKKDDEINLQKEASLKAQEEAKKANIKLRDENQKIELAIIKAAEDQMLSYKREQNRLEIEKQNAYTDALKKIIDSIQPEMIAAMTSTANAEILQAVADSMSPYAIARGESISETTNRLLRGTSLEGLVDKISEGIVDKDKK